ncbi:MAG: GNAT family N-acetyltransferase [Polaromonas sp.]|uniref:GNAT family N-acetyltransferase n=1 Tax=Polaromonas sp. TaxID=1869339 RepID=UPI003265660F
MRIEHLIDCQDHLEKVADWQQVEFGYLNPSVSVEQRQSRLRDSLQRAGLPLTIVAISEDGQPMGAASVLPKTITHAHLTPWLSAVVVSPEFRGKGIASALSLRAVAEAERLGFKTLNLFTPHNESLYRRIGWETVERSNHNGLPIAIMCRSTSV